MARKFTLVQERPCGDGWIEPHTEIAEMLLRNNGVHERLARGAVVEAIVPAGTRERFRYEISEDSGS
jgi:hypothetical protein